MCKNNKGFTLIELLIVIAIIGILASVVLASLNAARLKARNNARISELVQVKKALEMYFDDNNVYPTTSSNWVSDCQWGNVANSNNIVPGLVPKYIAGIPSDVTHVYTTAPLLNQSCTIYISDGIDYKFMLWGMRDPSPGVGIFDYSGYPTFRDTYWDGGNDSCLLEGTGKDTSDGSWAWMVQTDGLCTRHNAW